MLLNCGAGEYFGESLGLQGDQTSQSYRKSTLSIHWKDWCWSWSSSTLATDVKSWLTGKDPDAGKHWRQEKKGVTEDKMGGRHHQLNGHEFEQTPGDSEGQGTWHAAVHGVAKSQTWLCDQTTTTKNPCFYLPVSPCLQTESINICKNKNECQKLWFFKSRIFRIWKLRGQWKKKCNQK